jgi:hypothetical protein
LVIVMNLNRNGVKGKMKWVWMNGFRTKESAIEKTNHSENPPYPLFAKEGEFLPFVKLTRPPRSGPGPAGKGRKDWSPVTRQLWTG